MSKNESVELAKDRAGFVTGFKVKPRKINAKGETANPSTVVFTIEAPNDSKLIALLARIQATGDPVNFGIEPSQRELDFSPGA